MLTGLPGMDSTGGGCPACGQPDGTIRFNWKLAGEIPDGEFSPYFHTLAEQKPLKSGFLFKCPDCGRKWWLDQSREMITLVPREKLLFLEQWSSAPFEFSPGLFQKAAAIGATPPHHLSSEKEYAELPCRVQIQGNGWIDKCLVVFKNTPPLDSYPTPPRLLSEITDLAPSDFAFPLAVRLESAKSKQLKPGRALTPVKSREERLYFLNWTVNFLDKKKMRGKDFQVSHARIRVDPARPKGRTPLLEEPLEEITYFLGDWNEGIKKLLPPG